MEPKWTVLSVLWNVDFDYDIKRCKQWLIALEFLFIFIFSCNFNVIHWLFNMSFVLINVCTGTATQNILFLGRFFLIILFYTKLFCFKLNCTESMTWIWKKCPSHMLNLVLRRKSCICDNFWIVKCKVLHVYAKNM